MTGYLHLIIFSLAISASSCSAVAKPEYNDTIEVYEQFSGLQDMMDRYPDQLLVVNFWATSCPPCLKEMPHFNELESRMGGDDLKIILVSLDRAKDLDSRVYPFVKKLGIIPEVVLLEDQNYSKWTEKIDPSWYGALPATVIIHGGKRKFRFGAYLDYDELIGDVLEVMEGQ